MSDSLLHSNESKVIRDMDGLSDLEHPRPVLQLGEANDVLRSALKDTKRFKIRGMDALEIVIPWAAADGSCVTKLVWCLERFENLQVGGRENWLFHLTFGGGSGRTESQARAAVKEAFLAYHRHAGAVT